MVDFKTFFFFFFSPLVPPMVPFTHGRLPVGIKDSVPYQSEGILQMHTLDSIYGTF